MHLPLTRSADLAVASARGLCLSVERYTLNLTPPGSQSESAGGPFFGSPGSAFADTWDVAFGLNASHLYTTAGGESHPALKVTLRRVGAYRSNVNRSESHNAPFQHTFPSKQRLHC